jgi:hypothetical protein
MQKLTYCNKICDKLIYTITEVCYNVYFYKTYVVLFACFWQYQYATVTNPFSDTSHDLIIEIKKKTELKFIHIDVWRFKQRNIHSTNSKII